MAIIAKKKTHQTPQYPRISTQKWKVFLFNQVYQEQIKFVDGYLISDGSILIFEGYITIILRFTDENNIPSPISH